MSKRIKDEEYVSLLEQAVQTGTVHIDTGPMNAGKGKGDITKTGPEPGMKYRGVTVDGDKILNWEGGYQYHSKKLDDVDDLVETLTGEVSEEHDWDSPMSMLEGDDDAEAFGGKETEEEEEAEEEEKEKEEKDLDVDEELEESYNNVSFTSTETEVLSKLIQEMNMLEEDTDVLAEDAEESGESTEEEIDLDI